MNGSFKRICFCYVLLIHFWLTFCEGNVGNVTESTTIASNSTSVRLKKTRIKDSHSFPNGTINSVNNTKLRPTMRKYFLNLKAGNMVTVCLTPNEDKGYCMPRKNCKKLFNQIKNPYAQKFLHESRCGPRNENSQNPHVCCGAYNNYKNLTNKDPFPKTCGQSVKLRSRIFGGREAALGEFPWMARLIHRNKRNTKTFGCGGALITAKFILTAAHCLDSANIKILGPIHEVQLGEHNIQTEIDCNAKKTECADPPQVIRVKKRLVHPNYNSSMHHHYDIGLVRLRKAARFNNYVSPICLLDKLDFEPFEYWISGWGRTRTQNISPVKMKVSLPSFPHSNCTEQYKMISVKVIDSQICAGSKKNKDSCTGDSGGPLMVVKDKNHWFAAGIVSFGLGCGREGWPGVYTNVTSFLPWIRKVILRRIH